ncbi:MAG: LytTR family transcriptional regulator [Acholeplasmatales bacterium]|nr:MAG: LytTR family transcriptional regulator [Acholeplasmatales bacterium]
MFKLSVPKNKRTAIKDKLRLVETSDYTYVLTTDKDLIESDKINILFDEQQLDKVRTLLDIIAQGEDVHLVVYDELGQKSLESRHIQYFIVEADDIVAVSGKKRFIVKMKLYEIEEQLVDKRFIRVSKYALVNINKIDYIKPALNSKLTLLMKNGDEVEVNRHYYKAFKKTLRI